MSNFIPQEHPKEHFLKCKFCGYDGEMKLYVAFFPNERIMKFHRKYREQPKYGYHLGLECPSCSRWQKWIEQTDNMMTYRFYGTYTA